MKEFIAAVPYSHDPVDFARLLSSEGDVEVSRDGPQRRVQLRLDESRLPRVKALLPRHVVIEEVTEFRKQRTSVT
jgi:hypothetical protein